MAKPEISVIVPIYNVEKYLDKCVRSIQRQTFSDIEIILVDDGSTDRCGVMCDIYEKEDDRIHVIHKENGGLSAARNAGIKAARGKYIGFVDSDDYIAPDMYEILLRLIVFEDVDIAICGTYDCYANSEYISDKVKLSDDIEPYYIVDSYQAIQLVLESNVISVSACSKLYKTEVFANIQFPVGKVAEDAHIMIHLMDHAKKIAITEVKKYYYIHHEGTITTKMYHPQILNMIEAWGNNLVFIQRKYPALILQAESRYYWSIFYVLDRMMVSIDNSDPKKKRELIKEIRFNIKKILNNPFFQKSRKIAAILLMIHEKLYKICVWIYWKKLQLIQ